MTTRIDELREISRCCADGKPLPRHLAAGLRSALQNFLHRRASTLDEAFEIMRAPGGVPWWREEEIRSRDTALRGLARQYWPSLSVAGQARHISTLCRRYAGTTWRHDRKHEQMPAMYSGTPREIIWVAFKSGARMPIGERQLRHILAR